MHERAEHCANWRDRTWLRLPVTGEPRIGAGELLRAFRQRHGLAPDDLAALLGIEVEAVIQYERGEAPRWIGYALAGLEYQASGAMTDTTDGIDSPLGIARESGSVIVVRHRLTDPGGADVVR